MRKFIAILLIFLTMASVSGQEKEAAFKKLQKENPDFAASVLYADGLTAKLSGDYPRAQQLFNSVIKINPNHAAAYYQLAVLIRNPEYSGVALQNAEKAYRLDSTNSDFLSLYIETLIGNNKFPEASELLGRVRSKGTLSQRNFYFTVALAGQLGDLNSVEKLAEEYLNLYGFSPQVVDMLVNAKLSKRQVNEAEKILTDYIADYPTEIPLKLSLAKLMATTMRDDEALELFQSAIAIDSSDYNTHIALADYYRMKNDAQKYVQALNPVFKSPMLDPHIKADFFEQTFFDIPLLRENFQGIKALSETMYESDSLNSEIERVYLRFLIFTGEFATLKPKLLTQIEQGRDNEKTYQYLMELCGIEKSYDSLLYFANLGEKKFPKNADFPLMQANAYSIQKNDSEALKALARAMKAADGDSVRSIVKTFEGDLHYQMGNKKKAFSCYDVALKLDANNAVLLNNYAYFLSVERKRLDEALRMSKRANELQEGNSTFLDTEAWVLYQLGNYDEARTVQRRALALEREPSEALLMHYGDILFKLGNGFLAETYWKKAQEAGADLIEVEMRLKQLK